ncbi:MAG: Sec-independent protein translocase subunit TatA/TatB [Tissierella sp.]|uniref:Sec-independent protein translocase subunit TatA/TatB n=1 Tax=Tissierella sp. TaxID=41274 RepID=UPI003F99A82B
MLSKIGIWELMLILGIVLVVFGPSKLPELGKTMGQAISSFRKGVDGKDESTSEEETNK